MNSKKSKEFEKKILKRHKRMARVRTWNPFRLPSPKELGKSKIDALPSRMWCEPGDYTWDDYYEEMREKYPIRYFFSHVLWQKFHILIGKFDRAWYWLKCHVLPSKRYHMLDLRNVGPNLSYTHGFINVEERLLYAAFKILCDFFEKEHPENPRWHHSQKEIEKETYLQDHVHAFDEAKKLYDWWKIGRWDDERQSDERWARLDHHKNKEARAIWLALCREHDNRIIEKETEMLIRLIKIRKSLWT